MARKTVSLLPSILRLLIAVAIAGVLSLCSLAIERTKGFFKFSDGTNIHKIIGTSASVLLLPGKEQVHFARATLPADAHAAYLAGAGASKDQLEAIVADESLALIEQRAVSRVLHERVLKAVDCIRRHAALGDQSGDDEASETNPDARPNCSRNG